MQYSRIASVARVHRAEISNQRRRKRREKEEKTRRRERSAHRSRVENANEFIESIRETRRETQGRGGLLRQRKRGQGRMREGRVTAREIRRKAHSGRRKPLLISRQICLISQGDGVGVTDSEIRVRATFSSRMLSHTARL